MRAITEDGCANNELKANKDLLEAIIERGNLELAAKRVVANGGAGGVDTMGVQKLPGWFL